jgi:hypothetical protein
MRPHLQQSRKTLTTQTKMGAGRATLDFVDTRLRGTDPTFGLQRAQRTEDLMDPLLSESRRTLLCALGR